MECASGTVSAALFMIMDQALESGTTLMSEAEAEAMAEGAGWLWDKAGET